MVQYLIQLVKEIINEAANPTNPSDKAMTSAAAIAHEAAVLDTRDFLPAVQYDFAWTRQEFIRLEDRLTKSPSTFMQLAAAARRLLNALENYGGPGSHVVVRSFSFIRDAGLRSAVERDYRELSIILIPGGAWKSAVVLSGSILEAMLHDRLTSTPARLAAAETPSRLLGTRAGR